MEPGCFLQETKKGSVGRAGKAASSSSICKSEPRAPRADGASQPVRARVRDFSHSPRGAETPGQFPTSAASSGLAVFGFWVCFYGTKTSLHFLL